MRESSGKKSVISVIIIRINNFSRIIRHNSFNIIYCYVGWIPLFARFTWWYSLLFTVFFFLFTVTVLIFLTCFYKHYWNGSFVTNYLIVPLLGFWMKSKSNFDSIFSVYLFISLSVWAYTWHFIQNDLISICKCSLANEVMIVTE